MSESEASAAPECVVCCKQIEIYAVGSCNHPVCYECIVRMRVLCDQKECPICRKTLDEVICTVNPALFENFTETFKELAFDEKYGVYFETAEIKSKFFKTFENACPL